MKMQCCSIELMKFEIFNRLKDLKKSEQIRVKITKCPILKGTYDLEYIREKQEEEK